MAAYSAACIALCNDFRSRSMCAKSVRFKRYFHHPLRDGFGRKDAWQHPRMDYRWLHHHDERHFRADRMSCSSFRANFFRLFLHAAAFVMAYEMKHTLFAGTEVEKFTMDSFMKRIMLSAVYIVEKKTFIRVSFSPNHRHRHMLTTALERLTA